MNYDFGSYVFGGGETGALLKTYTYSEVKSYLCPYPSEVPLLLSWDAESYNLSHLNRRKGYSFSCRSMNLSALVKLKSILDLERFVGLLHIYRQFETVIDIGLSSKLIYYSINSYFFDKFSIKYMHARVHYPLNLL